MTAPSSPDRIEAVAQAIRVADGSHTLGAGALAEAVVAALDAYDREHRAIVLHSAVQAGRADLRERIATDLRTVCDLADGQADDGHGSFTTAWLRKFADRIERGGA